MTTEMTTGKPSKEPKALAAVLKSILCLTGSQESFSRSGLMRFMSASRKTTLVARF